MIGVAIVLLASFFFCFQNVIVRILFTEQTILGIWQTGGFVPPSLNHSLLLLLLRMVWVMPLMTVIAQRLYPQTWSEIHLLGQPSHRRILKSALGCGFLMFLYLVLLYISISLIPTGIAITLFFTYPVFTALIAWGILGEKPSALRWLVIGLVLVGSVLSTPYSTDTLTLQTAIGVIMGIASGLSYAFYTVFAQQTLRHLHPVPFTWISFGSTLVLSVFSLLIWQIKAANFFWSALIIGSLLSALFTFVGHLLTNWGIQLIGASRTAIIGATNPALTTLLAGVTIHEVLNGVQILGIILVTFSVALLNSDRGRSPSLKDSP